jgi:SAM-dependent methyltransferase
VGDGLDIWYEEYRTAMRSPQAGYNFVMEQRRDDVYTHGHQESVLRSHRWRTADNSAAYLLPRLRPGLDLLDVGCGPGTITADLAARVAPGHVVGLDRSAEVIAQARTLAAAVEWTTGDIYNLTQGSESFDVVHAHQVLQHLTDPVAALTEMRRMLRPSGVLAVRDSDYGAFVWSPADERLERWLELYRAVCARNGADADAGRRLPSWVAAAGFTDMSVSSSTWTFADPESRRWWGGLWADRMLESSLAELALSYGLSTRGELDVLSGAWRDWAEIPNALFVVTHVEVLATC